MTTCVVHWTEDAILTKHHIAGVYKNVYVRRLQHCFLFYFSHSTMRLTRRYKTAVLSQILTRCFDILQTTIDILKIDVDCAEWTTFEEMFAHPRCLANVKQLMVELHPCLVNYEEKTPRDLLRYWRTLRRIDALGFKLWKVWNNYSCHIRSRRLKGLSYYGCFNAYYLNIKYITWSLKCKLS